MTKTERILALLPRTFRAGPTASPLGALVSAHGAELQLAENALAALMRAHWVDHADRGAEAIGDLARFAALYGLAPRADDGVEEFRTRLKLWVKLVLEGPASVRNLLRASSALLGLAIDDSDAGFDPWWSRPAPALVTARPDGRDASTLVLGLSSAAAEGRDAARATLAGRVTLADPVDLGGGANLALGLDGAVPSVIDLTAGAADPSAVPVADVLARIEAVVGAGVARVSDGRLTLASPSAGADSAVEVADVDGDAAAALLGLRPRRAIGTEATAARYTSPLDLSAGVDLRERRYVRLEVDGSVGEIDGAAGAPGVVGLDAVRDAINAGLGMAVASHDGAHLSLTSPTTGAGSRIAFRRPAAQDATAALFGRPPTVVVGSDAAPARIEGVVDLSHGVDLSRASTLLLGIDGGPAVAIDCAGATPSATQLPELVATINAAAGAATARHNGRNLVLQGSVAGSGGSLSVDSAPEGDASEALLGLPRRSAVGADAVAARIEGLPVLGAPVNLWARSLMQLAIDRARPVLIDVAAGAADPGAVSGAEVAEAINAALGQSVAALAGDSLVLQSLSPGARGSLRVTGVQVEARRDFTSRIVVAEDAATAVLGPPFARAEGRAASAAGITGTRPLTRGVDLREARHLRIAVDGGPPVDVDCAGPRPRATTLGEVVERINGGLGVSLASGAGGVLRLESPTRGPGSRIELFSPRAGDAAPALLGVAETESRGAPATRPGFVGLVDIGRGVDLSAASHLRLAVDGGDPVEIDCAGPDPAATLPAQIAIRINVAMGVNVASHDGARMALTTPAAGRHALLEILAPAAADATRAILGLDPGRIYRGEDAVPARIRGLPDLGAPVDLSIARRLRLSVDGRAAQEIDCAAEATDPAAAQLAEIVAAINAAAAAAVASDDGGRLTITSPTTGPGSRLAVTPTEGGDARGALLGEAPGLAAGSAARPAEITGTVDLRNGVDLSDRAILPLAAGSVRTRVDVAGAAPERTSAEEIVAAINADGTAVAALTAEGTLRLTAPDDDPALLEVPALRWLELEEYLPEPRSLLRSLRHADRLRPEDTGVAPAPLAIAMSATLGVDAPGLVDMAAGWQFRCLLPLNPGDSIELRAGTDGRVTAERRPRDGAPEPIAPHHVLAAPLAPYLALGDGVARRAAPAGDGRRQLTLGDPSASERVVLIQRGGDRGDLVWLAPAADIPPFAADVLSGRLDLSGDGPVLRDAAGRVSARLASPAAPSDLDGAVVAVAGEVSRATDPPTVTPRRIFPVLDLRIERHDAAGALERGDDLKGVVLATIADAGPLALEHRLAAAPDPLMRARTLRAGDALRLAEGGGAWVFVEASADRFDAAWFDAARFAGPPRHEPGIFDVSRFAEAPRAAVSPVFAEVPAPASPPTQVSLEWQVRAAGSVRINLPKDLPRRFGARFDEDRFALSSDAPLRFAGVVFEPPDDDHFIVKPIDAAKTLITAATVPVVPIGFQAVAVPFVRPVRLTGGRADRAAQAHVSAPGLAGFVRIAAAEPGAHGNDVSLTLCAAGPGRYDLAVAFAGARFENARAAVRGTDPTGLTDDLIAPAARGVVHLKAGGIRIEVTRDGVPCAETSQQEGTPP